jgi:hypothetical protein
MRWITGGLVFLAVAWAAYFIISPYAALYLLRGAISEQDEAAILERVDVEEVRRSVSRQLTTAYLSATGREKELGRSTVESSLNSGAWATDPLMTEYVSAARVLEFLKGALESAPSRAAGSLRIGSAGDAWQMFLSTDRSLNEVVVWLPPREHREVQYGLLFRLSSFRWKVSGVELPRVIERRLIAAMIEKRS